MNMINQPPILHFESIEASGNVTAFTTTRYGGYSSGNYASFNLSYYSGDLTGNVDKNREELCRIIHILPDRLFAPYQVHGDEIFIIDECFLHEKAERKDPLLNGKDALITSFKDICIAVSTADCVPVLLYDPGKQIIGAVHAGWRGTCKRILQKVIRQMVTIWESDPSKLYAAIGPSIGPDAFEVGDEVYRSFAEESFDMELIARYHQSSGKYHIDLWEANRLQLISEGVQQEKIEIAGICTRQHTDAFFSARELGISSGRMLTGICMHSGKQN
ncbi:MAG: peptidoglycan editing factor PgeF [Bacteroidales bacterium]|jgi:YfiH family protein|nr:peptidoglycan editing factor PgeF [Bacteroidales bacterium]